MALKKRTTKENYYEKVHESRFRCLCWWDFIVSIRSLGFRRAQYILGRGMQSEQSTQQQQVSQKIRCMKKSKSRLITC